MIKQSLRAILLVLAIVLGTAAIVTFTFRLRALDSATYLRSLAPSGVYRELRFILEDQFIATAIAPEAVGTPFAESLVGQLDLPGVTITMMETNVNQLIDWINKDTTELRLFSPFTELSDEITELQVSTFTFGDIEDLMEELEPCTDDLLELNETFPVCNDPNKLPSSLEIQQQLASYIEIIQEDPDELSSQILKDYYHNPELEPDMLFIQHVSIQPEEVRTPINIYMQAAQDIAQTSALIGTAFGIIAVTLVLLVILLGESSWRGVLTLLGTAGIVSGVLVVLLGVVGTNSPEVILQLTVPGLFLVESYTPEMNAAFMDFISRLFKILFEMTLYTGAASSLVSLLIFITGKLLPKTAAERRASTKIGSDLPEDDIAPKLKPGETRYFTP